MVVLGSTTRSDEVGCHDAMARTTQCSYDHSDLTCKETMPVLDDADAIADANRGSREGRGTTLVGVSGPQVKILATNHVTEPATLKPGAAVKHQFIAAGGQSLYGDEVTVRDVVSSRMRNRASNPLYASGNSYSTVYNSAIMNSGTTLTKNSRYVVGSYLTSSQPHHSLHHHHHTHQQQYTIAAPDGSHQLPYTSGGGTHTHQKSIIGIAYAERRDAQSASSSQSTDAQHARTSLPPPSIYGSASQRPLHQALIGNGSAMKIVGNDYRRTVPSSIRQINTVTPPVHTEATTSQQQSVAMARGASPYAVVMPAQTKSETLLLKSSPSRTAVLGGGGGEGGGSTTPTGQNNHPSPRPSILRGANNTARRLLDKEIARPASTSALGRCSPMDSGPTSVNFIAGSGGKSGSVEGLNLAGAGTTSNRHQQQISSSSGEDSSCRMDDSPRKRPRKQQFDISQLTQDKLMMEVKADPKLEAASTLEGGGTWRSTSNVTSAYDAAGKYSSSGYTGPDTGITLHRGRGGRRRGRPRTVNRTDYLLSTYGTPLYGNVTAQYSATSAEQFGNDYASSSAPTSTVTKSYMVEVDSILQPGAAPPKRKYRKRLPEYDPQTGELLKTQKRGKLGRRSKWDTNRQVEANQAWASGGATPSYAAHQSVAVFTRFGLDEKNVISTLCRLKSSLKHLSASAVWHEGEGGRDGKFSRESSAPEESEERVMGELQDTERERLLRSVECSQPYLLSTLAGATKLSQLRPILKRSERNVEDLLSEQYDELSKLLLRRAHEEPTSALVWTDSRRDSDPSPLHNDECSIKCNVFASYEEMLDARDSLRLLPQLCSYLQNSQRLLTALRCNLLAHSVYKSMRSTVDRAGRHSVPSESLRPIEELKLVSSTDCDYAKESRREVFTSMQCAMGSVDGTVVEIEVSLLLDDLVDCVAAEAPYVPVSERERLEERKMANNRVKSHGEVGGRKTAKDDSSKQSSAATASPASSTLRFLPALDEFPKELQSYLFAPRRHQRSHQKMEIVSRIRRRRILQTKGRRETDQPSSSSSAEDSEEEGRRRADYLAQKISTISDRSKRDYDCTRKLCLGLLRKTGLESSTGRTKSDDSGIGTGEEREQQAAETSFLLEAPKHAPSPKKQQPLYNAHRSTTLRPPRNKVESLFGPDGPYKWKCNGDGRPGTSTAVAAGATKPKQSLSAERLKDAESRLILMEDLDEMESSRCPRRMADHLSRLQRRYVVKSNGPLPPSRHKLPPTKARTWRQPVNGNADHDLVVKSLVRETQEMVATLVELLHFRANLSRQTLESLSTTFEKDTSSTATSNRDNNNKREVDGVEGVSKAVPNFDDSEEDEVTTTTGHGENDPHRRRRRSAGWRQSSERNSNRASAVPR